MTDVGGYNYTRPRGPIQAMYSSPGPCYQLPTLIGQPGHDFRSTKQRRPAYEFGVKHGKFADDCSPGPCYLPFHKYYRDGPDGTPHYSLYGRNRDLTSFKTPGPGAYEPERAGQSSKFRHPEYSFGVRHRHRRCDNNPGPDVYSMPPMMGLTVQSQKRSAPIYSVTGRCKIGSFHEDLQKTPAPNNYKTVHPNLYKDKPPQYSMTSRNVMPGDSTRKPGPGAHSPEQVFVHKPKAPECSFGMRHSQYTAPLITEACD